MSSSEKDKLTKDIEAVTKIVALLSEEGLSSDVGSQPEDCTLEELLGFAHGAVQILMEIATAHVLNVDVPSGFSDVDKCWIEYCKSWCTSIELIAGADILLQLRDKIILWEEDGVTLRDGRKIHLDDPRKVHSQILAVEKSERQQAVRANRPQMDQYWKDEPPKFLLSLSIKERDAIWRITRIAIALFAAIKILFEKVKSFCLPSN